MLGVGWSLLMEIGVCCAVVGGGWRWLADGCPMIDCGWR